MDAPGTWLYSTVRIPREGPTAFRSLWEANLVAAAVREAIHAAGVDEDVVASEVSGVLPSGRVVPDLGGGIGNVAFGQWFADGSVGSIAAAIRANADAAHVDVKSVQVLRALQPAPAVVATTDKPAYVATHIDAVINTLFGGLATYEGEYLEVRDESGALVFIQASTFRSGVGVRWIRPDLDPRAQPTHGTPIP